MMFDLETSIREWKKDFRRLDAFSDGALADMELLLRDAYEARRREGWAEEDAFRAASAQVGSASSVAAEYEKNQIVGLNRRSPLRPARFMPVFFAHYLKVAGRRILREKGYAAINIAGLAMGLAAFILIAAYVGHEWSFDRFHENADRIFRVTTDAKVGNNTFVGASSVVPLGPTMAREFPEVAASVRIHRYDRASQGLVDLGDRQFYESAILYADTSIFSMFTFPLFRGDPKTALALPGTAVLTERLARKYFGGADPVGRTLRLDLKNYAITGVMRDVPADSHLKFDLLLSNPSLLAESTVLAEDQWFPIETYTYVLLKDKRAAGTVEEKLVRLGHDRYGNLLKSTGGFVTFHLQPLTGIHLTSKLPFEIASVSRRQTVLIFACIAVFILAIAIINFINLSTARAAKRAKEVGLRKVVGAERRDLVAQFLGEAIGQSLAALLIALLAVVIIRPAFRSVTGIDLIPGGGRLIGIIPALLGLAVFVGFAAGVYPAFLLASFRPARVLKAGAIVRTGGSRFRRVLVVAQFAVSIVILIGTGIVQSQIRFMKTASLGFTKTGILTARLQNPNKPASPETVKSRLKAIPGIVAVSVSSEIPGQRISIYNPVLPEGFSAKDLSNMWILRADADYLPAIGIEIAEGRNFLRDNPSDNTKAILINEAAARKFGWTHPLGKILRLGPDASTNRTIIGVVKDFHFKSMREAIEPLAITNDTNGVRTVAVRFRTEDLAGLVGNLTAAWKDLDRGYPFAYSFLDEFFDSQYLAEERLGKILASASILAMAIACLGLFGMASFMAEQRTKEIGVRKVLGAGINDIVTLLAKESLKQVGAAVLLAWPISYLAMNAWLRDFSYRTKISIWLFIAAAGAALVIAALTIGYRTIMAALNDPVDSLKYE